ncbi:hypothetical protein [Nannocystis pusilla]|uniref:Uncharacterized protein n=1 Tax=Nannocystis pusilla TaxID=889268 RepID=A0ABS7U4D1_9BACT|nr:hypothetical protein [Nannocystis pusilla]MBZ5715294.1 hypothetical protein [Nannocystis pusilla]
MPGSPVLLVEVSSRTGAVDPVLVEVDDVFPVSSGTDVVAGSANDEATGSGPTQPATSIASAMVAHVVGRIIEE